MGCRYSTFTVLLPRRTTQEHDSLRLFTSNPAWQWGRSALQALNRLPVSVSRSSAPMVSHFPLRRVSRTDPLSHRKARYRIRTEISGSPAAGTTHSFDTRRAIRPPRSFCIRTTQKTLRHRIQPKRLGIYHRQREQQRVRAQAHCLLRAQRAIPCANTRGNISPDTWFSLHHRDSFAPPPKGPRTPEHYASRGVRPFKRSSPQMTNHGPVRTARTERFSNLGMPWLLPVVKRRLHAEVGVLARGIDDQ